jgi:hypothetical protein
MPPPNKRFKYPERLEKNNEISCFRISCSRYCWNAYQLYTTVQGPKETACLFQRFVSSATSNPKNALTMSLQTLAANKQKYRGTITSDVGVVTNGNTKTYKFTVRFDMQSAPAANIIEIRARALLSLAGTLNVNNPTRDGKNWKMDVKIDTGSQTGKDKFPDGIYTRDSPALAAASSVLYFAPPTVRCGTNLIRL